ncbi:MAG: DnaJ domain-containing protein [Cyanobacteria bacterium P01_D01_bin.105]
MNLARHYRTLGLRRGASSQEVKTAYRTLVRQYHPDINPDEAAVERFIKINDAYTILSASIQLSERKRKETSLQSSGKSQAKTVPARSAVSPDENQGSNRVAVSHDDSGSDQRNSDRADGNPVDSAQADLDERLQTIRQNLEKLGFDAFRDNAASASSIDSISTETKDIAPLSQEARLKQDTYQQLKGLLKQQKFPRAIALIEGLVHRMPQDAEIVQWQAIVYQRWGRQLIYKKQPHKARIYLKKALRTDPSNRALWREVNRDFWQLASLGS